MAHAAVYGLTRIKVTLDSADSSDWIANGDYCITSYGFAPYASGDILFLGEYQADGSIIGLPLKSTSGDPVGERWDTDMTRVTPAIDRSACTLTGETIVIINIRRPD